MEEWLREYWQYALLLVGACVVAVFAFRAAAKAYSAHQKSYREEEAYIKSLKELKQKYVPLCEKAIENAPPQELLAGTALGIQLKLQKCENIEAEFEKLSTEKKLVYTLDIFTEDKTLERFFGENTAVLGSRLAPALEMIGLSDYAKEVRVVALMFDEKDETTSFNEQKLKTLDERLQTENFLSLIKLSAAKYIKNNGKIFCD